MDVEFTEESFKHKEFAEVKTGSKIGNWLIASGFAKDSSSASFIMIVSAIIIFGLSVYFFVYGFNLPFSDQPAPTDLELPEGLPLRN